MKIKDTYFFVKEQTLYTFEIKGKKIIEVGPHLELEGVFFDEERQKYIYNVRFGEKKFYDFSFRPENIEKNLNLMFLDTGKWKKYFYHITKKEIQTAGLYASRTGWFFLEGKEFFLTPSFQLKVDRKFMFDEKKMGEIYPKFFISCKEELHTLIRDELKEGTTLALLFLCAASAPFLLFSETSFSVFITGAAGVGKTTSALAACNLFYSNLKKITLYGTQTFRERLLWTLCDMPVLMDEGALEKDEKIETLLFLVESQKTKGRSTISLGLDIQGRRNVLFLTSERELDLSRLGGFRRCLFLSFENKNTSLEKAKYILNNRLVGAGYDYILYFWKNKEQILQYFHEKIKEKNTLFEPARALYLTLHILEGFYGEEFSKLREKVESLITEHEKRADFFEYAKSALLKFYVENIKNFYDPAVNFTYIRQGFSFIPKPEIPKTFWGFREREVLYLVPEVFSSFLKTHNLDRETFLTTMKSKGVLIMNDRYYYKFKKVPIPMEVPNNRYIALNLSKLELELEIPEHTEPEPTDIEQKTEHKELLKNLDIAIQEANRFAEEYAFEKFDNVFSQFQLTTKRAS